MNGTVRKGTIVNEKTVNGTTRNGTATRHDGLSHENGNGTHRNDVAQTGSVNRNGRMQNFGLLRQSDLVRQNGLMHLDEARQRIEADDCGKWDTTIMRQSLRLKSGRLAFPLDTGSEDESYEQWQHLKLSSWATGQLCARLGIPAAYFRRCPAILQDVQGNYWLRDAGLKDTGRANGNSENEENSGSDAVDSSNSDWSNEATSEERWLLRAKGDTLRAVLSGRYSPLDNSTLLDTLRPLLDARYRVDWLGLSPESLHLRVIDPKRTREVLPDDALSVGVHIANSEVGFRSVTVDALVYRLVCKNGLIKLVKGKSLMRQRHIHLAQPRFVAALQEAVEGALGEADSFIDQLRLTTRQAVPDVEGTLEHLAETWNLSDHLHQAMTGALLREPAGQSETVYGFVNAVTNVAQLLPDDGRYDLEVLAGRLAEHGVAAFAPPRRNKSGQTPTPNNSVFEQAREMFDAEVVSKTIGYGSGTAEVVEW